MVIIHGRYKAKALETDHAGSVTTHESELVSLWRVHSLFNNQHQMRLEYLGKEFNEIRTGWYLMARSDGHVYFGKDPNNEEAKWVFNDH